MIALLLCFCFAWQTGLADARAHLRAGQEADKNRQFDTAITEFRKATEMDPTLIEAFVNLGQAYMEKGEYSNAVTPLTRALELNCELAPAHQLLGYALLAQGYAKQAVPHLEKAGEQSALGIAQIETGQLSEAVRNLQAALAKRPNDPDLLYYLGRASGLLSKQSIDTLLAAYPDSARAHQALAENYFVLRQMPQAEREYQEALKLRPNTPDLHLELGEVYAGAFQWDKAEEEFRTETRLQPGNAEAAYRLGNALLQQGKARPARFELQRANQLLPNMPETLYGLGKAAALDGDATAAQQAWTQLLAIEREGSLAAQTHFALAGLYRKQGKIAQADRELQEFKKLQSPGAQAQPQ
ncbi:MAG TPA: tetratricopeptide repeat protein [Terriglobales bacterium]|nr:tetratricopeptide repeat protein [Terriglobales bacterium]